MPVVARASIAALLALAIACASARAEEAAARPARSAGTGAEASHACLNPKERRALAENGTVVHLAVAMHALKNRVTGTLVRARLCRRSEGLVYVLTVLGHDGKVARVVVDAVKGTLVGGL
jgi:uncharacterized membrane protein YkoI